MPSRLGSCTSLMTVGMVMGHSFLHPRPLVKKHMDETVVRQWPGWGWPKAAGGAVSLLQREMPSVPRLSGQPWWFIDGRSQMGWRQSCLIGLSQTHAVWPAKPGHGCGQPPGGFLRLYLGSKRMEGWDGGTCFWWWSPLRKGCESQTTEPITSVLNKTNSY